MGSNGTLVYNYTLGNEYPPPMITYEPVDWVAYVMAGLFVLLAARIIMVANTTKTLWFSAIGISPVMMFVSMILRGAMDQSAAGSDSVELYEASTVLHLCSGYALVGALAMLAAKWMERTAKRRGTMVSIFLTHLGIGYTITVIVCTCVGVPLAFSAGEDKRISGYKLVSTSLVISIGITLLTGALTTYHKTTTQSRDRNRTCDEGDDGQPRQLAVGMVVVPAGFLMLFLGFVLARFSLDISNVANTSDAMYYCLSILPLIAVLLMWTVKAEEMLLGTDDCCCSSDGPLLAAAAAAAAVPVPVPVPENNARMVRVVDAGETKPPPYGRRDPIATTRCCCECLGQVVTTTDQLCAKCRYEAMLQNAMRKYS